MRKLDWKQYTTNGREASLVWYLLDRQHSKARHPEWQNLRDVIRNRKQAVTVTADDDKRSNTDTETEGQEDIHEHIQNWVRNREALWTMRLGWASVGTRRGTDCS